ncbi:MAG TPA: cytochrome c3 family protein [Kofleriaceae bacterium]|nr:cytochrome c3 family protein [Kofleriaceae bacterium]
MKILRTLVVFAIVCAAAGGFARPDEPPFSPVVYPPQQLPLIFSHARHLARGTSCVTCHPDAVTSRSTVDNLLPTEAVCRGCHAIDRALPDKVATPVAACAGCHPGFAPGEPVARTYVMSSPLKFDHAAHGKQSCESCHGDLRDVDLATTRQLPTMQSCLSCHEGGADQRRCTTCHFAAVGGLMETKFPHGELVPRNTGLGDDHGPLFARDHKQQARRVDATCGACHDRSECVECHQGVIKPAEFHQGNYLAVHATEAKRGRPDCSACHRAETFCVACHERSGIATRADSEFDSRDPGRQFHPTGWASPGPGANLHAAVARRSITTCASCHREEDCLACHSAEPMALRISPHPKGWRGSLQCRMLDRGNRRMCLRCHITQDELGCDWSK